MLRRLAAGLLLLLVGAAAGGGFVLLRALDSPYRAYRSRSVLLTVPPGSSSAAIFLALEEGGVLRDRRLGAAALRLFHRGRTLKAGEYRFEGPRSPRQVVAALVEGKVVVHRVTVPEGLTAEEIFALFSARGLGAAADYAALFDRPAEMEGVPAEAPSLEGFLFPATYDFTRPLTARDVVARLTREFARRLPAAYEARARERALTVLQAVTLASLIEKETALADERPLVSAVYNNRLARGMLLQADPTTVYALKRRGLWGGSLTHASLALDDPYNTYVRPGLPPGPIASPGLASLEAAVAPAAVDYLFFVAKGDGSHRFATDASGHLQNVALWRKAQREERKGTRPSPPERRAR